MNHRRANENDCPLLAELNHQLIRDEGHRNKMSVAELEERMRGFLKSEYAGVIFETNAEVVAYALFRESADEIYLRQLFVSREHRRQGIGRRAMETLRAEYWSKSKRLTLDVLTANGAAIEFWKAMGYREYCLTMEIVPTQAD